MKRKKAVICLFIAVVAALVLAFALIDRKSEPEGSSINMGVDIYYTQSMGSRLASEKCQIDGVSVYGMALSAMEKMKEAPKSETLVSAIPQNVEIMGISVDKKMVTVDLSEEYNTLSAGKEMICRSAIVWTLTGLYFVDGVSITVDGVPLKKTNGEDIGVMTRENLIVNAEIDPEPTNSSRTIILYFADRSGEHLVKEERRIDVNINENLEKYVMEALIAGAKEAGHVSTIPAETKIRDIKTADGICYVDLSEDFVTKYSGGNNDGIITVYSIVNSLSELSSVKKVQFLIEGEKRGEFNGCIDFDKPFEPKEIDG